MSKKTNSATNPSLPCPGQWQTVYKGLDENGEGKVPVKKLGHGLRLVGLNPTEDELEKIIGETHLSYDGYFTFKEFEIILREQQDMKYEKEIMLAAFRKFDLDGNGFITKDDLMTVMRKRETEKEAEEDAAAMITEMDLNKDGMISYEGYNWQFDDDVIQEVDDFLNSQEKEQYKSGIWDFKRRWQMFFRGVKLRIQREIYLSKTTVSHLFHKFWPFAFICGLNNYGQIKVLINMSSLGQLRPRFGKQLQIANWIEPGVRGPNPRSATPRLAVPVLRIRK